MKYSYNWLKWYIPEAPDAKKLADIFTYHLAEVESLEEKDGDTIFDIKILPNRAHDLLSHKGLAREMASLLNIAYVDPTPKYKIPESKPTTLKIEVASDKCRRYMGRIIRGVKVGPSPEWVVKHLESIGQRSINNMVDAANLVMFDSGQPTHVFDLNKVKEKIVVRQAMGGETLVTLDNRDCKFKSSDLVIADSASVLGVAGVKGGKSTEVDNNTTDIILEVANFDPTSVRKTAQRLNIFTDAKKRFENDLSPELAAYAMRELSALIAEMCPDAKFEDVVDIYPVKQEERKLKFRIERIISLLGVLVTVDQIKEILTRYNIDHIEREGIFEIVVPPMRLDLTMEEDMAEEIGRIIGYDKVKGELPKINFTPKSNETYNKILWARHKLLADGYSEVMTTSFRNSGEVGVMASASDKNFLRVNLADGLAESYKLNNTNAALLGIKEIKIFEIGTVFKKDREEMRVAYTVKGKVTEATLDKFIEASPDASMESVDSFSNGLVEPKATRGPEKKILPTEFKPWSQFPFIARDVAVWVPEGVSAEEVKNLIKGNAGNLVIKGPDLFDEFKKDGKISYAFRLVFQSFERTLTDAEVNEVMTQITNKIKDKNGWQVR